MVVKLALTFDGQQLQAKASVPTTSCGASMRGSTPRATHVAGHRRHPGGQRRGRAACSGPGRVKGGVSRSCRTRRRSTRDAAARRQLNEIAAQGLIRFEGDEVTTDDCAGARASSTINGRRHERAARPGARNGALSLALTTFHPRRALGKPRLRRRAPARQQLVRMPSNSLHASTMSQPAPIAASARATMSPAAMRAGHAEVVGEDQAVEAAAGRAGCRAARCASSRPARVVHGRVDDVRRHHRLEPRLAPARRTARGRARARSASGRSSTGTSWCESAATKPCPGKCLPTAAHPPACSPCAQARGEMRDRVRIAGRTRGRRSRVLAPKSRSSTGVKLKSTPCARNSRAMTSPRRRASRSRRGRRRGPRARPACASAGSR